MSTIGTDITPCEAIQAPLARYFNTCPSTRRSLTPTLDWLNSEDNKSGIELVLNPAPGKRRTGRLVYDQPVSINDVLPVESCDKVCDATTERGDTYMDVEWDCTDGLYVEEKITLMDWMDSCEGNNEMIMRKLRNMFDGLIPAVAQKTAAEFNPLIGNWSIDVPGPFTVDEFLEVETLTSGGAINPQWAGTVNAAKGATGFCGRTLITGGWDLWTAWRNLNVGCCTTDGLSIPDILAQYGEAVVFDRWMAQEFGNNVSLMIQSQSVQLVNPVLNFRYMDFNSLADLDLSMLSGGWLGIVQDPMTGLYADLNVKLDCGVVHLVMTITTKLFGLPNNLYPEGHENEFVNFVTGIEVNNP